jgi:hypothetical protein
MKNTNSESNNIIDVDVSGNKHEERFNDQLISALVNSVRAKVPGSIDEQINTVIAGSTTGSRSLYRPPYRWLKLSMTAAAAAILMVTLSVFHPASKSKIVEKPGIAEIKTEIELSDKNIKILWVQKKDFKLRP